MYGTRYAMFGTEAGIGSAERRRREEEIARFRSQSAEERYHYFHSKSNAAIPGVLYCRESMLLPADRQYAATRFGSSGCGMTAQTGAVSPRWLR
eukprot:1670355-Rhodomonas_salina.7